MPVTSSRDGVEIVYATHGAGDGAGGPAVVLVHGWAGNRTYWVAVDADTLHELEQRAATKGTDLNSAAADALRAGAHAA